MLAPVLKKNDKNAGLFIFTVSLVVFAAVATLHYFKLPFELGFNVHLFALANAVINGTVSVLLVAALWAVKSKQFVLHKNLMLIAMLFSVLFLVSYIAHHLLAPETHFGGEHNSFYYFYLFILITHIGLATIILPFILFTAYRALTGEYPLHKKLARYTFPLWLYVSITGVVVYLLISPYYVPHI